MRQPDLGTAVLMTAVSISVDASAVVVSAGDLPLADWKIALGTGFGLRYDFGFIVLRGDLGIALHTPYKNPDKSGYYNIPKFKDGLKFHLAIGYPF